MGWQTKGGGSYYTRSRREGGRVVREYVGSGGVAHLLAQADALGRQRRDAEREEGRQVREAEAQADRLTRWYIRAVENVLRAHLTATGFHQHDRGPWRKKRESRGMMTEVQQAATAERTRRNERGQAIALVDPLAKAVPTGIVPDTAKERDAILRAAMNGDKAQETLALACIRAFPSEAILGWADPKNPCLKMISLREDTPRARVFLARVEQEYARDMKQVAGDNPTPLERLLAERITVLRFQITHFERTYELALEKGLSASISDHHMKRLDRLHKQYVRAIEALAKVRRLLIPAVMVGQVNVADKQVNIAAGAMKRQRL